MVFHRDQSYLSIYIADTARIKHQYKIAAQQSSGTENNYRNCNLTPLALDLGNTQSFTCLEGTQTSNCLNRVEGKELSFVLELMLLYLLCLCGELSGKSTEFNSLSEPDLQLLPEFTSLKTVSIAFLLMNCANHFSSFLSDELVLLIFFFFCGGLVIDSSSLEWSVQLESEDMLSKASYYRLWNLLFWTGMKCQVQNTGNRCTTPQTRNDFNWNVEQNSQFESWKGFQLEFWLLWNRKIENYFTIK